MAKILHLSLLLTYFNVGVSALLPGGSTAEVSLESIEADNLNERNLDLLDKKRLKQVQESRVGVKRLLAVRVSSLNGETPMESMDEMEAAIFGTGPNPMHVPSDSTLVAQFQAVSHQQLFYVPADDPKLTRPGLLDISIDTSTMKVSNSSSNRFDTMVRPTIMAETTRILGQSVRHVADRVLFCMPNGSLDPTVAGIGEVGGMFTFFHLGYCRKLDALMHELGHNLNFHHSGIGPHEYGDMTDYMGGLESPKAPKKQGGFLKGKLSPTDIAIDGAGYPKKAFNGHKHWTSGWFRDRALQIFPLHNNCTFHQRIVSFVEYGNEALLSNDFVLLRAGSLYIQYNRAKGYNVDASEANRVTVTEGFVDGGISVRVASLAQGENCVIPNFESSGRSLVIQVCTIRQEPSGEIDYADLIIYLDNDGLPVPCSLNEKVQCDKSWKPGSFFDRMLISIDEPVRSVVFVALLVGITFMTCSCLLLCGVYSRYYVIDRKSGVTHSQSTKNEDDVTVSELNGVHIGTGLGVQVEV